MNDVIGAKRGGIIKAFGGFVCLGKWTKNGSNIKIFGEDSLFFDESEAWFRVFAH